MESIAIIGKGPSIERCKREWIDKYKDVAICGRPIFDGYVDKIGNRAHYDFLNCRDPRIYEMDEIKQLGIIKTINTHFNTPRPPNNICPSWVDYDPNGRESVLDFFEKEYDLDPSGGTIAIEYILRMNKYKKIGLFGFDLMMVGEPVYFFPPHKSQPSLQYLYKNGRYSNCGINMQKSGHDIEKTYKYIVDVIEKHPDIQFEILSNREFPSNFGNITYI